MTQVQQYNEYKDMTVRSAREIDKVLMILPPEVIGAKLHTRMRIAPHNLPPVLIKLCTLYNESYIIFTKGTMPSDLPALTKKLTGKQTMRFGRGVAFCESGCDKICIIN